MSLTIREYGKRELLRLAWGYTRKWSGQLEPFAPPKSWDGIDRLVLVCKGNICRSAYAEAEARRLGFAAISFGLDAGPGGRPPNAQAAEVARRHGLDLSLHRTSGPDMVTLHHGDLLLCMEIAQAERCAALFPEHRVALLGLLIGKPNILDPYGRSDAVFERELSYIRDALAVAARLKGLPARPSGNVPHDRGPHHAREPDGQTAPGRDG